MKRCVGALLLLAGMSSLASADFIVIRVNVGGDPSAVQPDKPDPKQPVAPIQVPPRPPTGVGVPPPPPPPGSYRPGVPNQPNQPGAAKRVIEVPPLYATAIIEIRGIGLFKARFWEVQTKWGKTLLYGDQNKIVFSDRPLPFASLSKQYSDRQKDLLTSYTAERRLELAEWCLSRGLLKEFALNMEELAKANASEPRVKQAVEAYRQVLKAEMEIQNSPLPRDEAAIAFWKNQKGFKDPYVTDHYTIMYDAPAVNPLDVRNRGIKLENTFRGFYYWFALKGYALPMPKKKLMAVVIDKPDDFHHWRQRLDSPPRTFDGFFARRDHTSVFSTSPLDEAYVALANSNRQEYWENGWNMQSMLRGEVYKKAPTWDDLARCQTLALLQQTMLEEAEVATCTHVGARQLVVAAGLVPRNVDAPEWLLFGTASFFETPPRALWSGFGGPNWDYLYEYKQQIKTLEQPTEALAGVITDHFFQQARQHDDPRMLRKAQMLSWALTYYLAHRRTDGLMRYFAELASLPRDLELDQEVLVYNFAKAFDLLDPATGQIDRARFTRLAAEWFQYIWNTQPPLPDKTAELIRGSLRAPDDGPKQP
jgi:hypothetical protein